MPDQPSTTRRRSLLTTPAASAVLGALLLADVLTLPPETTAGAFVHKRLRTHEQIHCAEYPPLAYLVREGAQLRLASFDDPAAVQYRAGQCDPEVHRAILSCEPEVTRSGFWAITRASFDHSIRVRRRGGEALPADEAQQARALFVPYALERGLTPEAGRYMAQGDGQASIVRWEGYLRNAGSLFVGLGLLVSLRWVFA